jgi:hypothetical protein
MGKIILEKINRKMHKLTKDMVEISSAARKLNEAHIKVKSTNYSKTDFKLIQEQAISSYKDLKLKRAELKKIAAELKNVISEVKQKHKKNTVNNINLDLLAKDLDNIFTKQNKKLVSDDYLEKKIAKFRFEHKSAVKRETKDIMKNSLMHQHRKASIIGFFTGATYFAIDYFATKNFAPHFTSKKTTTVQNISHTPTSESLTPVQDNNVNAGSNVNDASEVGNGFSTIDTTDNSESNSNSNMDNNDISSTSQNSGAEIITEEEITELVLDEFLFTIATVGTALVIAILATKILYYISKYISEEPIKSKVMYGEHSKAIIDHAKKADRDLDKVRELCLVIEKLGKIDGEKAEDYQARQTLIEGLPRDSESLSKEK